jgi:hypothetical protein
VVRNNAAVGGGDQTDNHNDNENNPYPVGTVMCIYTQRVHIVVATAVTAQVVVVVVVMAVMVRVNKLSFKAEQFLV